MTFRKILCAVDLSQASLHTFRVAAEIARKFSQSLKVLHVIEVVPSVPELLPVKDLSAITVSVEEKAMAAIQSLIESSTEDLKGVDLSTEIDTGVPFVEILDHAQKWGADLIVIGAKGIATLEEAFVGRTAENLVRKTRCSILIVR